MIDNSKNQSGRRLDWGGESSHIDMVYVWACLGGGFFATVGITIGTGSSEMKEHKCKNWVYFEQILVRTSKAHKLAKLGVFLSKNGMLMGG